MVNFIHLLFLSACFLVSVTVLAQRTPPADPPLCGTPDLTRDELRTLNAAATFALTMKQASGTAVSGITYVPIKPHIYRRSNGTGGMTLNKLNNVMAITNSYYMLNGSGIQFYFCGTTPDYIDNDALYNSFQAYVETSANGRDALNAMNLYYVNAFSQSGLGGYAYFPNNTIQSTRSFILNEADEVDLANRLLPHEIGHNFSLYHTFGNSNSSTNELVTRGPGANCLTAGDELCDTPADPYGKTGAGVIKINGCEVYKDDGAVDAQGQRYSPSMTNIMSYYFPCTHDFTPGQYERIQAGLALRQSHTAYTLDCPPTVVAAPTNVTASASSGSIVISWQDNGTSEMGYFIERSTSPNNGFVPIGGVGTNVTTYTDVTAAAVTTYYYRVRPSNSTTQGISSVASAFSPGCRPIYGPSNCTEGDGLNSFVFNGTTLSQNSGCSTGGYNSSTVVSATVTQGQSYSFNGTLLSSTYQEGVSIWADFNRNGAFTSDELVYQTPTTINQPFSGSISFPSTLSAGPITIRVVVAYNTVPNDPCGIYLYGETEDYQLQIAQPTSADLSLSMKTSTRTPLVNQPISFSVTVQNDGPNQATGVSWQNRLPPNLNFVSADAGVVSSGSAVSGSGISINSGASATFVYQVRPTQPGTYINAAQIIASNQPDPDSEPNSGTGDGQDDAATIDIRTVSSAAGTVFTSPNPNQTPLPAVLSSQPPTDPTKADLSLAMMVDKRAAQLGQPVTFTIVVSNAGGSSASSVVVRDTLRGFTFISSLSGASIIGSGSGYTIIEATVNTINAGNSASIFFSATPTLSGSVMNRAQIWSTPTPDPDSTPGSVTPTGNNFNGEDDTAWIDLRITP